MIHIVNPQTSEILDYITLDKIIEDTHKKSLESYIETYNAIVLGGSDFSYDKHLEKRNHIIIPDEDGTYQEFILFEVDKYRDTEGRKTHFYAHATYLELKKAKVIYPTRREGFTLSQHAGWALNDTGWTVGIVEAEGTRTFNIENHTNPYEFIKRLANEFEVEIRFRVEHDGRRITARYVDFLERIGDWKGREVEFGKDLDSIRRIEKQDVVTALLGLGPEKEDGTRLEVLVEDEEALQRWGRVDEHGNLHHLIEPYEIQSERTEMTEEEARRYTRTALDKRINTQVTYETTILDLEEVPGLEHEKIRFGDTIRIKDTYFNPPLYLEARVFEIERSIKNKAKKDIKLGDYVEYTEEEVNANWNQLRNDIIRRLNRMAIVSITSTAGNVFKNAQGTTELTARTFVSGSERDEDGTLYDYQWMRFDKDGNHDTSFYAEGKTITVTANDIDEKATYRVLVAYELEVISTAEITISNVFDGDDGEPGPPGPKGEDGQGVENITIEYYVSDSESTPTGGTWTETKPTYQPGKYLWIRQKITYKNPTVIEYTTPILDDSWKAIGIAEEAKDEAQDAKTTADGKNSVFHSPTAPPTAGRKIGDIWFDTSRDNLMYRFNGTQWVESKWGEQSIVANSITANHIKSLVGLNVNDQFIVDSNGNVKFAGHLDGATGTFRGSIGTPMLTIGADDITGYEDFGLRIQTAQWLPDLDKPFKKTGYIEFNTLNNGLEIIRYDLNGNYYKLDGVSIDSKTTALNGYLQVNENNRHIMLYELDHAGSTWHIEVNNGIFNIAETDVSNRFTIDTSGTIYTSNDIIFGNNTGRLVNGGGYGYLQTVNSEYRVTKFKSTTYIPIRAASFPSGSLEKYKTNIEKWKGSALEIIRKADIYKYQLKSDIADGRHIERYGLVIGDGYRTPKELIDGDGIEQYAMNSINMKAIQELDKEQQVLKSRIAWLESENELLREKIKKLEGMVS